MVHILVTFFTYTNNTLSERITGLLFQVTYLKSQSFFILIPDGASRPAPLRLIYPFSADEKRVFYLEIRGFLQFKFIMVYGLSM